MITITITCDRCGATKSKPPEMKGATYFESSLHDLEYSYANGKQICNNCNERLIELQGKAKKEFWNHV